jgi:transcriptional regulator with XRE-family HTH domain
MQRSIGQKMKELRKEKKLTLREIAEQTGLSISFLSQVERMKSSLTLESLKKISDVLEVNPSYFFSEEDAPERPTVIRAIDTDAVVTGNPFVYRNLAGNCKGLGFIPLLVILNPGENKGSKFTHAGKEFLYVLEGTLTVQAGEEDYHLNPHDSIIIDSSQPHYWLNLTENPVKFLCVSTE